MTRHNYETMMDGLKYMTTISAHFGEGEPNRYDLFNQAELDAIINLLSKWLEKQGDLHNWWDYGCEKERTDDEKQKDADIQAKWKQQFVELFGNN